MVISGDVLVKKRTSFESWFIDEEIVLREFRDGSKDKRSNGYSKGRAVDKEKYDSMAPRHSVIMPVVKDKPIRNYIGSRFPQVLIVKK